MAKFIVEGQSQLNGKIKVQGSKNAALSAIAATVLTQENCVISNVPDILDVRIFLEILEFLGATYSFEDHTLLLNAAHLEDREIPADLVSKLRGSILLLGPLLVRLGRVKLFFPGGDAIGSRPIDVHLEGLKKLGAKIVEHKTHVQVSAKNLKGNLIILPVASVTGTENLIMASVLAQGATEIRLAATEPHVQTLCRFLVAMGAVIDGIGTPNLTITGVKQLRGAKFTLNADEIETVTLAVAAAATHGEVLIEKVELSNLDAPLAVLQKMNVNFETGTSSGGDFIQIKKPLQAYQGTKIVTGVFPHLLTDEQPLFGVLATQAQGETMIHDWIYEGRQGYLKILQNMGAKVEFQDIHRARIMGPCRLHAQEIKTPDLRAGASILIAALVAKGTSTLYNAQIIDRGYERLDERLNSLGARIERVK
ncbi:MAG: UDP-N-acetylglucosamine 1-carboxyvinyltransferase [bacterium]|nr:UDP-N-acetylglucosamine 1-carboxyvinyltransferase [bacterium]